AVGRIADITADRHMESVRIARWLLAPVPTFRLWRRMKLWELRSYEEVIRLEQDRLVYQARLRARYGRSWRRKAPVESLMPLRLARYGVPLADTAPAGLAAAGLDPSTVSATALPPGRSAAADETGPDGATKALAGVNGTQAAASAQLQSQDQRPLGPAGQPEQQPQQHHQTLQLTVPIGPNGIESPLGGEEASRSQGVYVPQQREPERHAYAEQRRQPPEDLYYATFRQFLADHNRYPSAYQFGQRLRETYGMTDLSHSELAGYVEGFKQRLPVGAGRSPGDRRAVNGHDRTAVPQQRREPEASPEPQPDPRNPASPKDPAPDGTPLGARTNDGFASTPPADTGTPPPGPPPEEEDLEEEAAASTEPEPDGFEPEKETTEQSPVVETVADRYYAAWLAYRDQEGVTPNGEQLSRWLFDKGVTGRNGKAVSPSTLRRYIASYPCYQIWAELADLRGTEPTAQELVKLLADRGVMRNNGGTPWDLTDLERLLPDFQRRRRLRSSG
ncbi:DUF2637 domain-containing protein, partial [Streptomyces hygroscopicus]|uniref:DUF2637 domain-containing protein n=1 Tax=Streptomyces hygroscopicus TaxID=1912 RepID=UPI0033F06679